MHDLEQVFLGLDIGTTAVKCMALSAEGAVLCARSVPYPSHSSGNGEMEQDPSDWIHASVEAVGSVIGMCGSSCVAAIALTGHMSSPVFLDRSHQPLLPCYPIADTRSAGCASFLSDHYSDLFVESTGNRPYSCFVASRLLWLKNEKPDIYQAVHCFIMAKDYVRGFLTGVFCTDPTDAGNTLLFDNTRNSWNLPLIEKLGLDPHIFPPVLPSQSTAGHVTPEAAREWDLPEGIPVICGAADMACSQIGTNLLHPGTAALTIGTSAQLCMRVDQFSPYSIGKLTFHRSAFDFSYYAMASIFSGGLSINWISQLLFNKKSLSGRDFEKLTRMGPKIKKIPPGSEGLVFIPHLTGSGSPYFDTRDTASFVGMRYGMKKEVLIHAVMEGVAYHIYENLLTFRKSGYTARTINLGGGGARIPGWDQMLSDILGCDLNILENSDATALGVCLLAASSVLSRPLPSLCDQLVRFSRTVSYDPTSHEHYKHLFRQYEKLYKALHQIDKKETSGMM